MKEILLSIIREISLELFITYKQNVLLSDMKNFNKCYSAIYLLEDIAEALDYYKNLNDENLVLGAKYLMVYGVLEALYLQQVALCDLSKSLGYGDIEYKERYPDIYAIREVRNDVAGHPTSHDILIKT